LSTHAIGPVRLLFGSLILLLVGAGAAYWWLGAGTVTNDVLVLRGGALEIESWSGDLRFEGSSLVWDHAVKRIQLSIAKAENEDEEFVWMDPIAVPDAARLSVDLRVAKSRTVAQAIVLSMEPAGVKIAVHEGQFAQKGDIWEYAGFVRQGRREPYEISKLEFRDAQDRVITRYENPDLGRRVHFRLRLNGTTPKR
jgi:hypothetical protein